MLRFVVGGGRYLGLGSDVNKLLQGVRLARIGRKW